MDRLWFRTIEIVTVIMVLLAVLAIALIVRWSRAALSRKDTEILYRDELFNRLSHSVDDVFLMLDGETSHADYISRTSSVCSACRSNRCGRTSMC